MRLARRFPSRPHSARTPIFLGVALVGCTFLSSCGSGSSLFNDNTDAAPGDFVVSTIIPADGQLWEVNRPIDITFSQPVNFATVTPASISIFQQGTNTPALGQFSLINNMTVRFQPACPTSSAPPGLEPGGKTYVISIPSSTEATSTTISATDGTSLQAGKTIKFKTPIPANPNDPFDPSLFYDPKVNQGPQVLQDPGTVPADQLPKIVSTDIDGTVTTANFVNGSVPPNKFVGPNVYFTFTFNQPVLPSPANLSSANLALRFESDVLSHTYSPVPTKIELIENCVNGLSKIKVTPFGLLPSGRRLRFVVSPSFSDIKGETNFFSATIPPASVNEPTVQGPAFPDYDAVYEGFTDTAHLDPDPGFSEPQAAWAAPGGLEASFNFGGQQTDLELVVNNGQEVIIDTTSQVLTLLNGIGSPVQASFQGGNIYLRKLTVKANGRIRGQGPNPLRFFVNETVVVEANGTITCAGSNGLDIFTLLTACVFSSPGGNGACGGGDGGTSNPITSQSSPQGGAGFGSFNTPNGGGGGGESSLWPLTAQGTPCQDLEDRHAAGGGGGTYTTFGEKGNNGTDTTYNLGNCTVAQGVSAVNPTTFPKGGLAGTQPFINSDVTDNFFGAMLQKKGTILQAAVVGSQTQLTMTSQFANFFGAQDVNRYVAVYKALSTQSWEDSAAGCTSAPEDPIQCPRSRVQVRKIAQVQTPNQVLLSPPTLPTLAANGDICVVFATGGQVHGELANPLGGQGGGAGGNANQSTTFPSANNCTDQKGGPGGGGGGIIQIQSLGDILVLGTIDVSGGGGAAGENTIGFDHIGGGGGGGAGGSIILESSTKVTLFAGATNAFLLARGGKRGMGLNGGTKDPVPPNTSIGLGHGGRGGKGLVQVQASDPTQVLFGANQPSSNNFDPNPLVLFATFGAISRSRSTWFDAGGGLAVGGFPQYASLGGTICPPGPSPCGQTGEVITNATGQIQQLSAIAAGSTPAAKVTAVDSITVKATEILVPSNAKAAEPRTMIGDLISITKTSGQVTGAIIGVQLDTKGNLDPNDDEFIFTTDNTKGVNQGGVILPPAHPTPLNDPNDPNDLPDPVAWQLLPRFFAITTTLVDQLSGSTQIVNDFIPPSTQPGGARVQIQFQGADADANGNVDANTISPDPQVEAFGTSDLSSLAGKRFIRFTASFNIAATPGTSPSPTSPRPRINFLKVPFRFN